MSNKYLNCYFKAIMIVTSVMIAIIIYPYVSYAEEPYNINGQIDCKIYTDTCNCVNTDSFNNSCNGTDCGLAWTGKPIKPHIQLTDKRNGRKLAEGIDYTVSCPDVTEPGEIVVFTVTGIGAYTGTREWTTTIRSVQLTNGKRFTYKLSKNSFTADGKKKDPIVTGIIDNWNGNVLEKGRDYEVIGYLNDINAGTGSVAIRGYGHYKGDTWYGQKGLRNISYEIPYIRVFLLILRIFH